LLAFKRRAPKELAGNPEFDHGASLVYRGGWPEIGAPYLRLT
jgi:hypothetical protein